MELVALCCLVGGVARRTTTFLLIIIIIIIIIILLSDDLLSVAILGTETSGNNDKECDSNCVKAANCTSGKIVQS